MEVLVLGALCMGATAGLVILVVVLSTQSGRDRGRAVPPHAGGDRVGIRTGPHPNMIRVVDADADLIAVVEAWPRLPDHVRSAIRELVRGGGSPAPAAHPPAAEDVLPAPETSVRPAPGDGPAESR